MRRERGTALVMAALAGGGAAVAVLTMPVGLIEMLVASTGISEVLPAAAPPLGLAARLGIAGFAGVMAIGIAWTMTGRTKGRGPVEADARGDRTMGFALSKLTALARGRAAPAKADRAPVLRRADAHPDAPARPPIFASRDFDGLDIFTPAETVAPRPDALDLATAPEPLVELSPVPAFAPKPVFAGPGFTPSFVTKVEAVQDTAPLPHPTPVTPAPVAPADLRPLSSLSVAELTERLERGLTQRGSLSIVTPRVIADMPIAAPVPISPVVDPTVDEALRAALGTLRTLATRAG